MNNSFIIYLFESSICMLFFYLIYIAFLRKETYFHLNRFYLISSIVVSLLIPVLEFAPDSFMKTVSEPAEVIISPIVSSTQIIEKKIEQGLDYSQILWWIYIGGVALLAARFVYQFIKLFIFILRGEVVIKNRHYLICTNGQYPTSSFFKFILWDNTVNYSEEDIDKIIKHEKTHVKQLHSLDNVLLEILQIAFWFNPVIYLFNKRVKEVHEYLADAEVLKHSNGYSTLDYEVLINKQVLNNIGFQLSNNFNMSDLKNRIAMTTKIKSGKAAALKVLVALPIIICLTLTFSYSRQTIVSATAQEIKETKTNNDEKLASFVGGDQMLAKYLRENTKYPDAAKKENAQGTVYIEFTVEVSGKLTGVKIAKGAGNRELDNEAVRMVSTMPDWEPAVKNGKKIASKFYLPIKFMIPEPNKEMLTLEGTYSGKNIYVTNPFIDEGDGFVIKKVLVNGSPAKAEIKASAFEIDLKTLHVGDKVKIEIQYLKSNSRPKVLNPEVISTTKEIIEGNVQEVNTNTFPAVSVSGISNGNLSVQQLLNAGKIELNKESFKITGFTMLIKAEGMIIQEKSESDLFTSGMKKIIEKLKPGAEVWIEGVYFKTESGTGMALPGCSITITE